MNKISAVTTIRLVLIPIFVVVVGPVGAYLLLRHNAMTRAAETARFPIRLESA